MASGQPRLGTSDRWEGHRTEGCTLELAQKIELSRAEGRSPAGFCCPVATQHSRRDSASISADGKASTGRCGASTVWEEVSLQF